MATRCSRAEIEARIEDVQARIAARGESAADNGG
jgi:hypothetical protein